MDKKQTRQTLEKLFQEQETEEKLARLADMPDLLDRYDALREHITRMSIFIDCIDSANRNDWDKVPKRVLDAFRLLRKEMRLTEKEMEQHDANQSAGAEVFSPHRF